MHHLDIEAVFRVPSGTEMDEDRLDAIYEAGFDDALCLSRKQGQLILAFTVDPTEDWEAELSERFNALDDIDDMEFVEFIED